MMGGKPFLLVYGTEAVARFEIGMMIYQTNNFQVNLNDKQLRTNLDLLEEQGNWAQMKAMAYQ